MQTLAFRVAELEQQNERLARAASLALGYITRTRENPRLRATVVHTLRMRLKEAGYDPEGR